MEFGLFGLASVAHDELTGVRPSRPQQPSQGRAPTTARLASLAYLAAPETGALRLVPDAPECEMFRLAVVCWGP